jgi:FlaA1/EpsC-like NDP-sugar epimerase
LGVLKERAHIAGTISLFADAAITFVSVWLAYYAWFLLYQYGGPEIVLPFTGYRLLPLYREFHLPAGVVWGYMVSIPVILVVLEAYGLHEGIGFRTPRETLGIVVRGHVVSLMVLAAVSVVFKLDLFRVLLVGLVVINTVLIFGKELIIVEYVRLSRERGYNFRNVLMVGVGEIARKMIERLHSHPQWGFKVTGCMVPPHMRDERLVNGLPNLGVYDETPQVLKAQQPDLVVAGALQGRLRPRGRGPGARGDLARHGPDGSAHQSDVPRAGVLQAGAAGLSGQAVHAV